MNDQEPGTLSRRQKLGFGLITMALAVIVALLLGEMLARLLTPQREAPRWFILDKKYGYFQRKNFEQLYRYDKTNVTWRARLNELGLRGPAYGGPRADERRVLCIGDSFTFGYGLDEERIFPTKLEQALNADGQGDRWRVINAGVGGWGTVQQTMFAREHFELFKPDVIVLTLCDNDANDDRMFTRGNASGLLPGFPGKRWIRDHSILYGILYGAVAERLYAKALDRPKDEPPALSTNVAAPKSYETDPAQLEVYYGQQRKNWQFTLDTIREFHRDYLQFNPKGLLLIQMAQPYRFDLHFFLRMMDNGSNLILVDMLPESLKMGEARWLLPYDPHWSAEVHDLSTEKLHAAIRKHLPSTPGPGT